MTKEGSERKADWGYLQLKKYDEEIYTLCWNMEEAIGAWFSASAMRIRRNRLIWKSQAGISVGRCCRLLR
ncbi:hypothetical protein B5F07_21310 [Lachnoclostridium sp. An169]|nr:hypothetical protein B5F07_21310 [Lachnoclostridium sp. An169]